jgi:glycosyltransferase involved in cell wall biosynthesis
MAVLEALALAKPTLLSTAADPMGRVAESGAGIVTRAEVGSLAEALATYANMSDDDLRARGERGRTLASTEFEWSGIARLLVQAYGRYAPCR